MIISKITREQLTTFLNEIDGSFEPKLSERVNLINYSEKLISNAEVYCVVNSLNRVIACLLVYANNISFKTAYVPIVGVLEEYRGNGLLKKLFDKAEEDLINKGFEFIALETWLGGIALNYYVKNGYYVDNVNFDRPNGGASVNLKKDLILRKDHLFYYPTPLEKSDIISLKYKVNVYYKRDDLFAVSGGGSKGRKLAYIMKKAIRQNCDSIVTAGANQSNHVRSTSVLSAQLAMKSSIIIHDKKPSSFKGNAKLTNLTGAKLTYVEMDKVKSAMNSEIVEFISNGFKPFYIFGGGHCVEGTYAYYKAVYELKKQLNIFNPDFIILASGTGGTQAGIEVGVKELFPNCKVLGVSVAREKMRGSRAVIDSANELIKSLNLKINRFETVHFDDNYIGDGYESVTSDLLDMIKNKALDEGLFLDPTYSGKAYYAMLEYLNSGIIPEGSNVVFWHTGSLMNLLETKYI